jgi:hypothetical protein
MDECDVESPVSPSGTGFPLDKSDSDHNDDRNFETPPTWRVMLWIYRRRNKMKNEWMNE